MDNITIGSKTLNELIVAKAKLKDKFNAVDFEPVSCILGMKIVRHKLNENFELS